MAFLLCPLHSVYETLSEINHNVALNQRQGGVLRRFPSSRKLKTERFSFLAKLIMSGYQW